MIMTYLIVTWLIGAVLAIRVVKTGAFPTKEIADTLLDEGIGFIVFLWLLFPIGIIMYTLFNIPYFVHYLIFEKEWRKK